ncbi:hypothetical protein [Specibacter cremeus]|uniref:hypothetical protein n=1 Tax=Specibacter cremeus TaxID=1629051 RepID=UPI0013DDE6BA|nr:hypothetical protein [Specibacter cremeus]
MEQRNGVTVVHDDAHGSFPIRTVAPREPDYASYRWDPVGQPADAESDWPATATL